ncbi:tyrosine-type recombinase/integrase [Variovorax sp. DAIF25]|uniref:tyrosine-type recombinase/integrase n=1 Tax=Variovorax sp. DAIF25 TaxID=3080983 RepID=UPI003D6C0767
MVVLPGGKFGGTASGGLYLEVTPAGAKHWRWKYRFDGKEKRLAIGSYPAITLGEARAAREKARLVLKAGTDPVGAKRDAKASAKVRRENTFKAVTHEWFEHWKSDKSTRHAENVKRRLEGDVYPKLGRLPITEIMAPKLLAMAKKIEARGALDVAKRMLQSCGQILRYAVAHGLLERNPGADVKPADALKPRKKRNFARLDAKDMPELLRKIQVYDGSPTRSATRSAPPTTGPPTSRSGASLCRPGQTTSTRYAKARRSSRCARPEAHWCCVTHALVARDCRVTDSAAGIGGDRGASIGAGCRPDQEGGTRCRKKRDP